jgi:hypothetical protein
VAASPFYFFAGPIFVFLFPFGISSSSIALMP